MPKFALWVELDIKPAEIEAFLRAAREDAYGSVTNEPGCHRFDILRNAEQPTHVCFYEVYDDEAAFDAHRQMPHFKRYAATVESMIDARKITRLAAEVGGAQ